MEVETTLVRARTHRHPAREVLVYTPAGYDSPEHANDHYVTLYLLHGSPGVPSDFVAGGWPKLVESASRDTGDAPTILVIPDGNYAGEKHGDS
jgi:hypothetical protein